MLQTGTPNSSFASFELIPREKQVHHLDCSVKGFVVQFEALLYLDEPVDEDCSHAFVDLRLLGHVVLDFEHRLEKEM